jgi:hypothetical protein
MGIVAFGLHEMYRETCSPMRSAKFQLQPAAELPFIPPSTIAFAMPALRWKTEAPLIA